MEDSKLHEETLKIAKSLMESDPALKDWVTEKFPELKESEDERIRKAVLKAIMTDEGRGVMKDSGFKVDDILYWLENQGEQKSVRLNEGNALSIEGIIRDDRFVDFNCSGTSFMIPIENDFKNGDKVTVRIIKQKQGEQKPAWSKEDEWKRNELLQYLKEMCRETFKSN